MSTKKPASKESKSSKKPNAVDDDGWEILGGNNAALEVGECCEGTFHGVVRTIPGQKKGQRLEVYGVGDRALLANTALKMRLEEGKVQVGDKLRVTRLDDGTAKKGQNAPKLFDVRVKRAKGGRA